MNPTTSIRLCPPFDSGSILITTPSNQTAHTKMTSMLTTLDRPICMIANHVVTQATTLRIKHHTKGGFTATDGSTSETLYNVDGRKGLGPRRVFHDANGQTILEMRRYLTGNETYVGVPNDHSLPAAVIATRATLLKARSMSTSKTLAKRSGSKSVGRTSGKKTLTSIAATSWYCRSDCELCDNICAILEQPVGRKRC